MIRLMLKMLSTADCRLRYANFMLLIMFMCGVAVFLMIVQSEVLPVTKGYKPDFGETWFNQWLKMPPDKVLFFQLNTERAVFETDKRFLSFSIDSSQIHHGFINPTLSDRSLRKIVGHIGGGYLRLGGKAADALVFSPAHRAWPDKYLPLDGGECSYENRNCPDTALHPIKKFSMSAKDWMDINEFAIATGMKLLFGLNVLLRTNDTWDSSNAELLLDYSFAHHYSVDWELGNEPNSFRHTFGIEVQPENLASDFNELRKLLQRYAIYNSSLLAGPDVTAPKQLFLPSDTFLTEFLSSKPDIDAITWHHYYTGPNAALEDFLNPATYDSFRHSCRVMMKAIKDASYFPKPVWIGETGSAYGGGAANLSDRFVASLLWIDKLGTAAKEGMSLVVRQSLYKGNYALLNEYTLIPNADFWVSVIYKRLVRRKVLNISYVGEDDDGTLRAYAHCSEQKKVVIFGVNLAKIRQGISLVMNVTASFFSLSGSPGITSKEVSLNGESLRLTHDLNLPFLEPVTISMLDPVSIPPQSVFFIQLDVNASACGEI